MTELVFTAGERATLDLRDSSGQVTIKDWDGATIKVEAPATPYVLREQDTFRLQLPEGGTVSLPIGLPAEVVAADSVRVRVMRAGGETDVRAAPTAGAAGGSSSSSAGATPRDFAEFADVMADYGKRIVKDIAKSVRSSGVSEDVARKLEEAAERIDEKARQAAERLQREVERTVASVERHEAHGRRAEEHARRVAERVAERVQRHAERHAHRAERHADRSARRGRWWFTERWDEAGQPPRESAERRRESSQAERLAIMEMLRDGKIDADQAAKLLDALGA
ncbi:MAG TPA: hypothetical protein VFX49_05290 [Chloroflexota bacterium]|nr:hypothetical protein [Chloroflexota bacterium]